MSGACSRGCTSYCLYNNCSFSCGGDSTIETGCSSSSCSATGRKIHIFMYNYLYILLYINYILGVYCENIH